MGSELDEACRHVGRFLHHFALLEEAMNALIGQALELNEEQTAIVAVSVPFYKKIELIQAAIQAQSRQDEPWKKAAVGTLNKISDYNSDRNIVAHHGFTCDEAGSVVFRHASIDRKSKTIRREPEVWTPTDFDVKCAAMDRIRAELERVKGGLMPVIHAYAHQLLDPPETVATGYVHPISHD